jgi:hypothetical protein
MAFSLREASPSLAEAAETILLAREADRIGKGTRDARRRDAYLVDVPPAAHRGRGYGFCQALYTVGAVIGPLAAVSRGVELPPGSFGTSRQPNVGRESR